VKSAIVELVTPISIPVEGTTKFIGVSYELIEFSVFACLKKVVFPL
jgi:hypothetical protein